MTCPVMFRAVDGGASGRLVIYASIMRMETQEAPVARFAGRSLEKSGLVSMLHVHGLPYSFVYMHLLFVIVDYRYTEILSDHLRQQLQKNASSLLALAF